MYGDTMAEWQAPDTKKMEQINSVGSYLED